MARNELRSRGGIEARTEEDRRDKDTRVERGTEQVDDAGHVATAGERVELRGTDEGAAEVRGGLERGLENAKDVHSDHVVQADAKFAEVKETEVELGERSGAMARDAESVRQELSGMRSADTTDARAEVKRAAEAGSEDAEFLRSEGGKEQETRDEGSRAMEEQARRIAAMKIGGR